MFKQLDKSDDLTSVVTLTNTDFLDSDSGSIVKFLNNDQSKLGWLGGCGKIACTGRENILLNDTDGKLLGAIGQAVPNNPAIANS